MMGALAFACAVAAPMIARAEEEPPPSPARAPASESAPKVAPEPSGADAGPAASPAAAPVAGEGMPPTASAGPAPGSEVPPARPRFLMSAAVGISIDNHGIADGRNVLVPSLAIQGGIGDGAFGFEARLFASEAAGRFSSPNPNPNGAKTIADVGADRQAVDLLLAVRPFQWGAARGGATWAARFVQAITADIGLAVERVSVGTLSTMRGGAVVGAHLDVPLVRSADGSELRAMIAGRRMLGTSKTLEVSGVTAAIGDSKLESFAGLTVVF
ncbi:MAG TPA: hypothetical protein VIU64_09445 [Polyangia bacterium]